ncbi:hypothetical protein HDU67_008634, partial [Dinochytrium kinnereticum]
MAACSSVALTLHHTNPHPHHHHLQKTSSTALPVTIAATAAATRLHLDDRGRDFKRSLSEPSLHRLAHASLTSLAVLNAWVKKDLKEKKEGLRARRKVTSQNTGSSFIENEKVKALEQPAFSSTFETEADPSTITLLDITVPKSTLATTTVETAMLSAVNDTAFATTVIACKKDSLNIPLASSPPTFLPTTTTDTTVIVALELPPSSSAPPTTETSPDTTVITARRTTPSVASVAPKPPTAMATTANPPPQTFYKRPLPDPCIAFHSPLGKRLFRRAITTSYMESYYPLSMHYTTQSDPAFCGLTSLCMVLNSLEVDPFRRWKGCWRWFDEEMLECCWSIERVRREGITLPEFGVLARCNGLEARIRRADDGVCNKELFISDIKRVSKSTKEVMVVSFSRQSLLQTGTGHFSPIGGYDEKENKVLIFDVARFKYPAYWVSVDLLWESIHPIDEDTGKPRGYLLLRRAPRGIVHCALARLAAEVPHVWPSLVKAFVDTGGVEEEEGLGGGGCGGSVWEVEGIRGGRDRGGIVDVSRGDGAWDRGAGDGGVGGGRGKVSTEGREGKGCGGGFMDVSGMLSMGQMCRDLNHQKKKNGLKLGGSERIGERSAGSLGCMRLETKFEDHGHRPTLANDSSLTLRQPIDMITAAPVDPSLPPHDTDYVKNAEQGKYDTLPLDLIKASPVEALLPLPNPAPHTIIKAVPVNVGPSLTDTDANTHISLEQRVHDTLHSLPPDLLDSLARTLTSRPPQPSLFSGPHPGDGTASFIDLCEETDDDDRSVDRYLDEVVELVRLVRCRPGFESVMRGLRKAVGAVEGEGIGE